MDARIHDLEPGGDLQAAIDGADAGDIVRLAPGTYPGPVVLRTAVTVRGGADLASAERYVIDAAGRGPAALVEDGDDEPLAVRLEGLTLTGGNADMGGGLSVRGMADVTARAVRFLGNRAGSLGGGAVYAGQGTLRLEGCLLADNQAGVGGALLLAEVAMAVAVNCAFARNEARTGGALRMADGALLTCLHCSFADNRATDVRGGVEIDLAGNPSGRPRLRLANSVVFAERPGSLSDAAATPAQLTVSHSVVPADWKATASGLRTEGEVLFGAAKREDRGGIPTVAAGGTAAGLADWTLALLGGAVFDIGGVHRLADERVDPGAREATDIEDY